MPVPTASPALREHGLLPAQAYRTALETNLRRFNSPPSKSPRRQPSRRRGRLAPELRPVPKRPAACKTRPAVSQTAVQRAVAGHYPTGNAQDARAGVRRQRPSRTLPSDLCSASCMVGLAASVKHSRRACGLRPRGKALGRTTPLHIFDTTDWLEISPKSGKTFEEQGQA